MAEHPCSCMILAGGNKELSHDENKAFVKVAGQRVLDRLMAVIQPLFDEIILVTNDPSLYLAYDAMIVTDHFDFRSSLTSIHAGVFAAGNPHTMVLACDMPFVQPQLLKILMSAIEPHLDIIIPKTPQGLEPLMAIYSKRCLNPIKAALMKQQGQIIQIIKQVRLKEIEESELRREDADLTSFIKLNSPAASAVTEKLVAPPQTGKNRVS